MEGNMPHGKAEGNIYPMVIKKFHETDCKFRSEQIIW